MNIRRFIAANSRLALRDVREALGGDAVILANRPVDGGVEILAAASGDLSRLTETQAPTLRERTPAVNPVASQKAGKPQPKAAPARTAATPVGKSEPDWLSEAQIVRTRKRIASLLDENTAEVSDDQLLADILHGQDDDARTTLSAASRQPAPLKGEPTQRREPVLGPAPLTNPAQAAAPTRAAAAAPVPVATAAAITAPISAPISAPMALPLAASVAPVAALIANVVAAAPALPSTTSAAHGGIADEMRSMRGFIEDQLATLAWRDGVTREPSRMRLLSDLISAGLSPILSRSVIDHLPQGMSYEQAREWVTQILKNNLNCATPATDITESGGVFALVGPTGVGKTTTAAKMAARFAVKHGVNQLALITTDAYRIGAQDQLRIYGKILGIPVQTIHDQASLQSSLSSLAQKKLVLIDTAGLSQRDDRVAEQIAMLRGVRAQRLLILNATVQSETLEETVRTYASSDCAGCIITKIDEAVRLGGVLDVAIRNRLKLHFVSNGQRVPEDIHHPNPAYLVHRALRSTPPNRIFDISPAEQPAWLAAVAQSALAMRGAAHV